jgi:hypothetical protein
MENKLILLFYLIKIFDDHNINTFLVLKLLSLSLAIRIPVEGFFPPAECV